MKMDYPKELTAWLITDDPSSAELFRQALSASVDPKIAVNVRQPSDSVGLPTGGNACAVLWFAGEQTETGAIVKILREIRSFSEGIPVCVFCPDLSEKDGDAVKNVYAAGADLFRPLPCPPAEAAAAVCAAMRLAGRLCTAGAGDVLRADNVEMSLETHELKIGGKKVSVPPLEFELLYFLMSNPGRVFTRDNLLDKVWGYDYLGDSRTVDVHVKRLRKHLEGASDKWALKTVWGVGYKFEILG